MQPQVYDRGQCVDKQAIKHWGSSCRLSCEEDLEDNKTITQGTLRALTRQPHQQCLSDCDALSGMRQDLSNAAAGMN